MLAKEFVSAHEAKFQELSIDHVIHHVFCHRWQRCLLLNAKLCSMLSSYVRFLICP